MQTIARPPRDNCGRSTTSGGRSTTIGLPRGFHEWVGGAVEAGRPPRAICGAGVSRSRQRYAAARVLFAVRSWQHSRSRERRPRPGSISSGREILPYEAYTSPRQRTVGQITKTSQAIHRQGSRPGPIRADARRRASANAPPAGGQGRAAYL